MEEKKPSKKQIPLRLSDTLFKELSRWAEDDFRSLNGQIEYLLTEAVRDRRKKNLQESGESGPKSGLS
ncbi:MAG: Arc family DNA-binding protein [Spirochaetales bacterium]|nr:Arc family DNA-binding protein [Spirochaetales bacterium]